MNRFGTLAFAVALLCTGVAASPPPSAAPSATPTPDPAIVRRAQTLFAELQAGKLDRSQLDSEAAGAIDDAKIKQAQDAVGKLGTPVTFEQIHVFTRSGVTLYVFLVTFGGSQKLDFGMALDKAGKVNALTLLPPD